MPADLSPVRPGNAERFSRMVQLATTADDGDKSFAAFEALLAAPRAHARLALEKVTERGLLYLWKGASSDRPVGAEAVPSERARAARRQALRR